MAKKPMSTDNNTPENSTKETLDAEIMASNARVSDANKILEDERDKGLMYIHAGHDILSPISTSIGKVAEEAKTILDTPPSTGKVKFTFKRPTPHTT